MPVFVKSLGGGDAIAFGVVFLNLFDALVIGPGSARFDPVADDPGFFPGKLVRFFGRHFVVLNGAGCDEIELAF